MEGLEPSRPAAAGPLEVPSVPSEHTLSTTLKTYLRMETDGLGLALIQNGPYIQIANIIDKGAADKNGRLKQGDVLIKIGYANMLGSKLREVRHMLLDTPVGTVLQIMVYRDLVDLPLEWENLIPTASDIKSPQQIKGVKIPKKTEKEDAWTSSEDDDDDEINLESNFRTVMAAKAFWHDSSTELPPVSKYWHTLRKNIRVFTVGVDIGCDIMIHRPFGSDPLNLGQFSASEVAEYHESFLSPYWTMVDDVPSLPSSSTASESEILWLEECSGFEKDNSSTPAKADCLES